MSDQHEQSGTDPIQDESVGGYGEPGEAEALMQDADAAPEGASPEAQDEGQPPQEPSGR